MTPYFLRHTFASTLAVILTTFVAAVPARAASKAPAPVALTGSLSDTRVLPPATACSQSLIRAVRRSVRCSQRARLRWGSTGWVRRFSGW